MSLLGIAFAVLLMFAENGFLNGVLDSQTLLIKHINADLLMSSRQKGDCYEVEPFARARLIQARQFAGVTAAYPLYMDRVMLKNLKSKRLQVITALAFDPLHPVFADVASSGIDLLNMPYTMLYDQTSRAYAFGKIDPQDVIEVNGLKTAVVGGFRLYPNFMTDGHLIMSAVQFFKYFSGEEALHRQDKVEYGVIQVAPGVDVNQLSQTMNRMLPQDVRVMTKAEMIRYVEDYWKAVQPVVEIFGLGMTIGFIIGIMICYQILFTDIADHIAEFATLKAIGYSNRFLVAVVVQESLYLSFLGFLPGFLLSVGFYTILQHLTGILMHLTATRILTIFFMTIFMCMLSAILAVVKVLRTDAAEVF